MIFVAVVSISYAYFLGMDKGLQIAGEWANFERSLRYTHGNDPDLFPDTAGPTWPPPRTPRRWPSGGAAASGSGTPNGAGPSGDTQPSHWPRWPRSAGGGLGDGVTGVDLNLHPLHAPPPHDNSPLQSPDSDSGEVFGSTVGPAKSSP